MFQYIIISYQPNLQCIKMVFIIVV